MIIDITGVVLTPGNCGDNCLGNGQNRDENGNIIECCCDECDYMICCLPTHSEEECKSCDDKYCPKAVKRLKP